MNNAFPTEAEWKEFVKKYKVPDKVAKAHSKPLLELNKLFDSSGLNKGGPTSILATNAAAAKTFLEKATKASHEFTRTIDLDSGMEVEDRKKLKTRWAVMMLNPIQNVHDGLKKVVDPFAQSRANAAKAITMHQEWLKNKQNTTKLTEMYGQGMRNHLGANFNSPPGEMSEEVKKLVKAYQETVAKWMDVGLNASEASQVVKDPVRLQAFEKDMDLLIKCGKAILEKTKP